MPRSIWKDVIDFAMVNTSVEFYTDLEFGPSTYRNRFRETSMQLIEAALEAQGMGSGSVACGGRGYAHYGRWRRRRDVNSAACPTFDSPECVS